MTVSQPPAVDARSRWQAVTTVDGLLVHGSEHDGFHVSRDHVLLASYYDPRHGDAGRCPFAALARYRDMERERVQE